MACDGCRVCGEVDCGWLFDCGKHECGTEDEVMARTTITLDNGKTITVDSEGALGRRIIRANIAMWISLFDEAKQREIAFDAWCDGPMDKPLKPPMVA